MLSEAEAYTFRKYFNESYVLMVLFRRIYQYVSGAICGSIVAISAFFLYVWYFDLSFFGEWDLTKSLFCGFYLAVLLYLTLYVIPHLSFGYGIWMAIHQEFRLTYPGGDKTVHLDRSDIVSKIGLYQTGWGLTTGARWFNLTWLVDTKSHKSLRIGRDRYPGTYFDRLAHTKVGEN